MARWRLVQAQAESAAAALLVAEVARTGEVLPLAWERLNDGPYQAARVIDHQFSDTGSFYFHQLARPPHEATVIKRLNRPGRPPAAPLDTVSLQNRTGVDGALGYLSSFFSSASRFGLFREHEDIEATAQDELLGAMQRRLLPCYADLAKGLDEDSLLQREDLEQALRQASRGAVPGVDEGHGAAAATPETAAGSQQLELLGHPRPGGALETAGG